MRILIFSDTHGAYEPVQDILAMHPGVRAVIFLGDGEREMLTLAEKYDLPFHCVRGNNDYASLSPDSLLLEYGGKRIYAVHGHLQGVKHGFGKIRQTAQQVKADILLFGHTHIPYSEYEDGCYLFNPGSIGRPYDGRPSYGILDITSAGLVPVIAYWGGRG